MAVTIAIENRKGGVGKTTTAEALTAGLTERGYRALVIDLDDQANLTFTANVKATGPSALGLITGEAKPEDTIQHISWGDIIPANKKLATVEYLLTDTGKEYKLKEALESMQEYYSYIIIDTPPALNLLTINALTAADYVIIPAQAEIYSLQGIGDLSDTIGQVKRYCNKNLQIAGLLLTRYNPRAILSKEVTELAGTLAKQLNTIVLNTKIREGIAIKEAQISQKSIYEYAPNAKVTGDYKAFINEVVTLTNAKGAGT